MLDIDRQVKRLAAAGWTLDEIATSTGLSESAVKATAKRLGVAVNERTGPGLKVSRAPAIAGEAGPPEQAPFRGVREGALRSNGATPSECCPASRPGAALLEGRGPGESGGADDPNLPDEAYEAVRRLALEGAEVAEICTETGLPRREVSRIAVEMLLDLISDDGTPAEAPVVVNQKGIPVEVAPPHVVCNPGWAVFRELERIAARDGISPGAAAAVLLQECLTDSDDAEAA